MSRHRFFAIVAAASVAAVLGGCSLGPIDFDDYFTDLPSVEEALRQRRESLTPVVSESALKEAGTLTVGIPVSQTVPLSVPTGEGELDGLSVEMAHALADELGISEVSFVKVNDVESALESQCDVVIGVEPDDVSSVTVLGPFAQSATGVFARGDVSVPIDASQMEGASVGVQEGSVSAVTLDGYDLDVSRAHFSSLNEAFEALENGSVQYVICDAYAGAYLAAVYSDVSLVGTLDEPTVVGISAANLELEEAVRAALETLDANSLRSITRASWVGGLPDLTEESQVTGLVERVEEPAEPDGEQDGETPEDGDETAPESDEGSVDDDVM